MTAQPKIALDPTSLDNVSKISSVAADVDVAGLETECSVFSRYLAGRDADRYVRGKYIAFHRTTRRFEQIARFDSILLRIAVVHPWLARVADAYSARFDRCSTLRKKLSLLAGIMECTPDYAVRIDAPFPGPLPLILARMGLAVAASAAALALSIILIAPLHLALGRGRAR